MKRELVGRKHLLESSQIRHRAFADSTVKLLVIPKLLDPRGGQGVMVPLYRNGQLRSCGFGQILAALGRRATHAMLGGESWATCGLTGYGM